MKSLIIGFLVSAVISNGQTLKLNPGIENDKGIKFEKSLTWEEIKQKAKKENKLIFVDCYATWCGPCKAMDKNVYPKDSVGKFVNENFISIKVQFDTSKEDAIPVKKWYVDAHALMNEYKITSFPSFLFFSSDGKIVHRDVGYKRENEFIQLIRDASDYRKQLYSLLQYYKNGKKDYENMPYLVKSVKSLIKDESLEWDIARDYIENNLYQLPDRDVYTKDNISFIGYYLLSSKEKGFDMFYKYPARIDSLIRPGFSHRIIDNIIVKEEINKKIYKDGIPNAGAPDWNKLENSIKKKYGSEYSSRVIINSKIKWFQIKNDWKNLAKMNMEKINRYGLDTSGLSWVFTNNMIWTVIFMQSDNEKTLNWGIKQMESILRLHPDYLDGIDTYANLLYKVGRIDEAIEWEEKAVRLDNDISEKLKRQSNRIYEERVGKMRKGKPTWVVYQ